MPRVCGKRDATAFRDLCKSVKLRAWSIASLEFLWKSRSDAPRSVCRLFVHDGFEDEGEDEDEEDGDN
jgi:hypothetical protein